MFSQSIAILDNDIVERYCDTSNVVRYLKTMSLRAEEWKKDEQWFQSVPSCKWLKKILTILKENYDDVGEHCVKHCDTSKVLRNYQSNSQR